MRVVSPPDSKDWCPKEVSNWAEARSDLLEGMSQYWLWTSMAMHDIRLRYRGSLLGPFWVTITTVVMISAMGMVYAYLFKMPTETYLPFLTMGLIAWYFISGLVNEGCQTFLAAQTIIHQTRLPFSVHVFRLVFRNFIVLAHNFVIIPFVLMIFQPPLSWRILWIFPALILLAINGTWVSFLFGMISARFRDIPPIIANILQILFFVTPIFWSADLLGRWKFWAELNPLFALIDLFRSPLLGLPFAPNSWLVAGVTTVIGSGFTYWVFVRCRKSIAYWV